VAGIADHQHGSAPGLHKVTYRLEEVLADLAAMLFNRVPDRRPDAHRGKVSGGAAQGKVNDGAAEEDGQQRAPCRYVPPTSSAARPSPAAAPISTAWECTWWTLILSVAVL
jgi:hypothetical protein